MLIEIDKIRVNPEQPREVITEAELMELAVNIQLVGLINPIAVMAPNGDGFYTLIDGERRWRACGLLGWKDIPAEIHGSNGHQNMIDGDQARMLEMAVSANMLRKDMNPVEEARAVIKLRDKGMTVEDVGRFFGRSAGWVQTRIDLLFLEPEVIDLFGTKKIGLDNRALYGLKSVTDKDDQVKLARHFAAKGMGAQGIKLAIARYLHALEEGPRGRVIRERKAEKGVARFFEDLPKGGSLSWLKVRSSVQAVCDGCFLAEFADKGGCKDCPMILFIRRVTEHEK